jgi:bacillithiol system protein YtxJ
MNWHPLHDEAQLSEIKAKSYSQPVVIFKHSTRCSISSMALNRLERSETPEGVQFYMLDLIRYRNISNKVAVDFGVHHESPQVLLIRGGECVYDESHGSIHMADIAEQVAVVEA